MFRNPMPPQNALHSNHSIARHTPCTRSPCGPWCLCWDISSVHVTSSCPLFSLFSRLIPTFPGAPHQAFRPFLSSARHFLLSPLFPTTPFVVHYMIFALIVVGFGSFFNVSLDHAFFEDQDDALYCIFVSLGHSSHPDLTPVRPLGRVPDTQWVLR